MEDNVKSGLKGCLSLFFVTGIVLSYCFQCAHDRNVAEQERRFRESDARPALGAAYEWRSKSASERSACWEKEGYDNFEDWYYAEMDGFWVSAELFMSTLPSYRVEIGRCTLKRPNGCTAVAVFLPGDTFPLSLYSE